MSLPLVISPSLLAADPMCFATELSRIEKAGANWHHVDVMDGHFVPNLSYGLPLIKAIKKTSKIPLDVHIMISNPDDVASEYVKAGADLLVFHIEASSNPLQLLKTIKSGGAKAGIALNPDTPVESVFPLLDELDLVLMMSVHPGFGGQKFIEATVDKTSSLHAELKKRDLLSKIHIEIDGGITDKTAPAVIAAGATALVAGTYIYRAEDASSAIKALKNS